MTIARKWLRLLLAAVIALSFTFAPMTPSVYADEEEAEYDADAEDIEYARAFIERLYVNMMGRTSDEGGMNYWLERLSKDEVDGDLVADGFYFSNEFTAISADLTNEEYASRMYITILGREPDANGLQYWVDALDSGDMTRDQVYRGFLGSQEWHSMCAANEIISGKYQIGRFVDRMYSIVLGREADPEGRNNWIEKIHSGEDSAIQMAYGFFFSPEYLGREKSNSDYVKDLYLAFMGREFDNAGLEDWCSQLDDGEDRIVVMNGFALSNEFSNICDEYGITRGEAIRVNRNNHNGIVVCIDPGHSAVMPGGTCPLGPGSNQSKPADAAGTHGVASGLNEYQLTLMISLQLRDELEARGYTVIMTREDSNGAHDLVERATVANEGADIMVRIHADGLDNHSVTGCCAICITPGNPWNPQTYSGSRLLADCLLTDYIAATGIRNRGIVEEDTMAGNNWSTVPCVLFELGFMTNPTEDMRMADPAFQVNMVNGLADGVDRYFGNTFDN